MIVRWFPPPYSPDIAPYDYHLFRPLKQHLVGKTFLKSEDLKLDITNFFESQPLKFWAKGIIDLPNRWANVENCGEYINWSCFSSKL